MTKRVCTMCSTEFPITEEFWHKDASRHLGFMYTCRACEKTRGKKRYKLVPNKYKLMYTETQKENKKEWSRKYNRTEYGRAVILSSAYRKIDKAKGIVSDITAEYMIDNIFNKSCTYCGETGFNNLGCDRKDNTLGHVTSNVVPCCTVCNLTRSDLYTHEEMKILGATIRKIKDTRKGASP